MNYEDHKAIVKAAERYARFSIFGFVSTQLEPTDSQKTRIKQTYEAVSEYLAASSNKYLQDAILYPHGSIATGTAIKPISGIEIDVDVMCHLQTAPSGISAQHLFATLGDRLKMSADYGPPKLERKKRCWRINFAGDFHLDATPSVKNTLCTNGGELVPDRELQALKETNPKAFAELFQRRARLQPTMRLAEATMIAKAEIISLPDMDRKKCLLELAVQLFKRHRDQHFEHSKLKDFKPISIIITTLSMRSYERVVLQSERQPLDDELAILIAVAQGMPDYIDFDPQRHGNIYMIENETTTGENFADRWNNDSAWVSCFTEWHKKLMDDLYLLASVQGQDAISQRFAGAFMVPKAPIDSFLSNTFISRISNARNTGSVRGIAGGGLVYGATSGSIVKPNTYFGI